MIEQLAEDLQISRSEIYRCTEFYQRYPEISQTLGKLSWNYIHTKLLPRPTNRKFQPPPLYGGLGDEKYRGGPVSAVTQGNDATAKQSAAAALDKSRQAKPQGDK